jgi:hypothetical protein
MTVPTQFFRAVPRAASDSHITHTEVIKSELYLHVPAGDSSGSERDSLPGFEACFGFF